MFDPNVGVWLQEDPIDFDAGDVNLHRYVRNNPINNVDPSGLTERSADGGITTVKTTSDEKSIQLANGATFGAATAEKFDNVKKAKVSAGVYIFYRGADFAKVQYLQAATFQVEATTNVYDFAKKCYNSETILFGGPIEHRHKGSTGAVIYPAIKKEFGKFPIDPDLPEVKIYQEKLVRDERPPYHIDVDSYKSPFYIESGGYGGDEKQQSERWMYDGPTIVVHAAEDIRDRLKASGKYGNASVAVTGTFFTFVLVNSRVEAYAKWKASGTAGFRGDTLTEEGEVSPTLIGVYAAKESDVKWIKDVLGQYPFGKYVESVK